MTTPIRARPVAEVEAEGHVRPLSVGDILDTALRLYRAHFKLFFTLLLVLELPAFLAVRLYQNAVHDVVDFRVLTTGRAPASAFHPDALVSSLAFLSLTVLLMGIARAALVGPGAEAWHGRPVTVRGALTRLRTRFPAILRTYVLFFLLVTLGIVLGTLPGFAFTFGATYVVVRYLSMAPAPLVAILGMVAVMLGLVVVWLFLLLRWMVFIPAVVLEGQSGRRALKRSAVLTSGRVGPGFFDRVKVRASLLLLVVFFLLMVPQLLVQVPHWLLMRAYSPAHGVLDPLAVPFVVRFPLELAELLIGAVVTPFSVLATLVFYFDLRVRKEGYDLELRAQALGGAAGAGSAPVGTGGGLAGGGVPGEGRG